MGASDPSEDSADSRVNPRDREETTADSGERVDVVWFPADDDYVVVAAGDGDRAVAFHRYGRYGVAGIGVLFAALGVVVLHGFVTANTALAWPLSGVAFAVGAVVATAYAYWRYDPEAPPEVVARDEPVDSAKDEFDFED
ncbi:hypothetical protein G9C85_17765 [Halorubellus sp. JP-L1]|uniref:hypothetical protein n=1 Tax=Halorubellus sp. JP-L1 TaxID=2715753 RepID=UPI00140D94BD|nr:hypothetical protein [Halorubellus sp. JP-L1]NHN43468.1 hypothetical protein [Halorubellus sp. JP-L1]